MFTKVEALAQSVGLQHDGLKLARENIPKILQ